MLCGEYPVLSETFVWREVQSLNTHNVDLKVATLRNAENSAKGIAPASWVLFDKGVVPAIISSIKACILAPKSSLRTLLFVGRTSVKAKMSSKNKAKVIFQGFCSLGFSYEMRAFSPDWLHCHFAHASATYALFIARFLNIPWSFTGHANDLFQRRILLEEKLNDASGIACISHWHKDFYYNLVPNCEPKLHIIRCGVDIPEFSDSNSISNFSIISVGRLIEKKGFHILLEACIKLRDINNTITINIIGSGPEQDNLNKLATKLPENIKVNFWGALEHKDILAKLTTASLFVMPCIDDKNGDRDGIPVSMMEAMAAGVPVLAGNLPAIRELIQDDVTGWVRDATPEAFESTLREILSAKERIRTIGDNARAWVYKEFSTDINTKRLIKMIHGE